MIYGYQHLHFLEQVAVRLWCRCRSTVCSSLPPLVCRHVFPLPPELPADYPDFGYVTALNGLLVNYRHGKPVGKAWIGVTGFSQLVGDVDEDGRFTGDHQAYLYPDTVTAYVGRFEDRTMVAARAADLVGHRCDEYGIKEVRELTRQ